MSVAEGLSVAWISRGRLFVQKAGTPVRELESDFAKQALQRELRDNQLNAWKGRSGVWGNLGMQPPGVAPWENPDPRRQIRFVSMAKGESSEELFYVLDMGAVGGLFSYDMEADIEKRLVHRQGFVLRHLSRHAVDGELAMALPREDGTVGLKITRPDGLFGKDITCPIRLMNRHAGIRTDPNVWSFSPRRSVATSMATRSVRVPTELKCWT